MHVCVYVLQILFMKDKILAFLNIDVQIYDLL